MESNYYSGFRLKCGYVNSNNLICVPIEKCMIPVRITNLYQVQSLEAPVVNVNNFSMPVRSISTLKFRRDSFELCLLNSRSIRNKALIINDFITDHNIDIMALTETWLSPTRDEICIDELWPDGFQFIHSPRDNNRHGGGIGLLYKDSLQISQSKVCDAFLSFEYLDTMLLNLTNVRIFVIYRPPPSQVNGLSASLFFMEFSDFLEKVVLLPENILILGDFNFHVNDVNDPLGKRFLGLLESFNLRQQVFCPTFNSGYTLDLIITRSDDDLISNTRVSNLIISDHYPVFCNLDLVKPLSRTKHVSFRNLKSVCLESFKRDISVSFNSVDNLKLSMLVSHYHDVLSSTLDSHAPVKRRTVTVRVKKAPWYTPAIDFQKKVRRRFERRWRATGLTSDKAQYSRQCAVVNKMLYSSKQQYFSKLITDNENDQRSLFKIVSKLLQPKQSSQYPTSCDDTSLANSFLEFFSNKIKRIRQDVSKLLLGSSLLEPDIVTCSSTLCSFQPLSCDEVSRLMGSTVKSCSLDPVPASLLMDCRDVLIPVFTKIINLSLLQGELPESLKIAKLTPILKKPNADHEIFSNFRNVSNLPFLSKLIEKAVACQLNKYLADHNLHDPLQSAYKAMHSTETALVRIYNDILQSIDDGNCVILIFLDISAAFDTVVHDTLLDRLSNRFGIEGVALSWFKSYLSNRKQFVGINNSSSYLSELDVGVPQGSVLGPVLYLLYTSPLADIVRRHNLNYHFYADDSQLYLSFKDNDQFAQSRLCIEECISDISQWMLANGLKLNHDKTDLLYIHSKFQRCPPLSHVQVCGDIVVPCLTAVNLGVVFDNHMTGELQVNSICKSSYFHLRNLSAIRKYLTTDVAQTIIHAFITSKLDYCNSLLYGIPKYLVERLQRVQNSAARVVTLTRKYDHITPVLIDLHWLPVYYRVIFKMLLLTYKSLNGLAPIYLSDLLSYRSSSYALRSVSNQLLVQPKARLSTYGFRSFSVAAPRLWNNLPFEIRSCASVEIFKKKLKTYLFSLFLTKRDYP